ncbi:MAG: NAD(P)-binding protein [Anaerolineaceae bacterium]|nr:NAD(P)-binding protein [Anaerolineaceae bacterium]
MRDVVIIGGGLSGLAAAYELEKHQINYSLIEVKRHLGGSIHSVTEGDFVMDGGAFVVFDDLQQDWLAELNLADEITHVDGNKIIFNKGTQAIVEAIADQLSGPRLMRMAVSSLGEIDGRYAICMENGLMFDARTIIIAAPARYAERMLYNLRQDIALQLGRFHYDSIHRVNLVYPTGDLPEIVSPPDAGYAFINRVDGSPRTPAGYTLLQFGMRFAPESKHQSLINLIRHQYSLAEPAAQYVGHWPEADMLSSYDDAHDERVRRMRAELPPGIALIGSDYCMEPPMWRGVHRLNERIQQGRDAAHAMIERLRS